jgi:hypothetical protein
MCSQPQPVKTSEPNDDEEEVGTDRVEDRPTKPTPTTNNPPHSMNELEAAPIDAELDTSRSSTFLRDLSIHITRHPRLQSSDFIDPFAFEHSERMNNTKHSHPFPRITYPKENGRKQIP